MYEVKTVTNVKNLLSRYGYLTEDLSTTEMRNNWIGAGRIKIIDLQTNEVLAERKGYFRARGDILPPHGLRWWGGGNLMCPKNGGLLSFLHSTLQPVKGFPSDEQLEHIASQ